MRSSTLLILEISIAGFTIPIKMPIDVGLTMKAEIKKSLTRGSEKTWSSKSTITFTAPAWKNYRVTQFIVKFKSEIPGDEIALYTSYKVEETTGVLPRLSKFLFLFNMIICIIKNMRKIVQSNYHLLI